MKYSTIWAFVCLFMVIIFGFFPNIIGNYSVDVCGLMVGVLIMMFWCALDDIIKLLKEIKDKK